MRLVKGFTPNWFTAGMGTGILALDAFLLPGATPWLQVGATALWILNMVLVAGLFVRTPRGDQVDVQSSTRKPGT